jgi:hypothetical protein
MQGEIIGQSYDKQQSQSIGKGEDIDPKDLYIMSNLDAFPVHEPGFMA